MSDLAIDMNGEDSWSRDISPVTVSGFIRFLLTGELDSGGGPADLYLELNDRNEGYRGLRRIYREGSPTTDAPPGPFNAIHLIDNGDGSSGTFSSDGRIAWNKHTQKIMINAVTTFAADGNDRIIFDSHFHLVSNGPLKRVTFRPTPGAAIRGSMILTRLHASQFNAPED